MIVWWQRYTKKDQLQEDFNEGGKFLKTFGAALAEDYKRVIITLKSHFTQQKDKSTQRG